MSGEVGRGCTDILSAFSVKPGGCCKSSLGQIVKKNLAATSVISTAGPVKGERSPTD